jgi:hypothetical protein
MKTHPITDHVPEAELTAITPEGAARWLKQRGWTNVGQATRGHWWVAPEHAADDYDAPTTLMPVAGLLDYAKATAEGVAHLAQATKVSPRTIIAEMQADSRIVAELQRMSAAKKEGGA